MGVVMLCLAITLAVIAIGGLWALVAWQRSRQIYDVLAERLSVDARTEQLTTQTLAAIREMARRGDGAL